LGPVLFNPSNAYKKYSAALKTSIAISNGASAKPN
jgi:hypothetical protein